MAYWIVQVVGCVFFADFLSGLVHWLEDSYGDEDLPLLGSLVTRRNNLHHQDPSFFTQFGYWHGSWLLIVVSLGLGLVAWSCGVLDWRMALVLALGANANHVHRWAHRPRARNGRVVNRLMDWRLIPSQGHHARHHTGAQSSAYCVLTPHLNPLLERIRFWESLERLVELTTGRARRDPTTGAIPVGVALRRAPARAPRVC